MYLNVSAIVPDTFIKFILFSRNQADHLLKIIKLKYGWLAYEHIVNFFFFLYCS